MSFFKKLFGGPNIKDDINLTVGLMEEMANESERVYRNMVEIFNNEINSGMLEGEKATVSWKGIFKTRLLATMYPASMFVNKWKNKNKQKAIETMNITTGIAVSSLHDSDIQYDRKKAGDISMPFIKEVVNAIKNEFNTGPSRPSSNYYTDGFQKIEEISHDALSESIGKNSYTLETKNRFQVPIKSGIVSALQTSTESFGN